MTGSSTLQQAHVYQPNVPCLVTVRKPPMESQQRLSCDQIVETYPCPCHTPGEHENCPQWKQRPFIHSFMCWRCACCLKLDATYLPTFNEHLVFISLSVQSLSDACIYVQGLPQHLQQPFTMASENSKLEFWQGSYKEEQAKTHSLGCLF